MLNNNIYFLAVKDMASNIERKWRQLLSNATDGSSTGSEKPRVTVSIECEYIAPKSNVNQYIINIIIMCEIQTKQRSEK